MRAARVVLVLTLALGCGSGRASSGSDGADAATGRLWSARGSISDGYLQAIWGSGDDVFAAGMSAAIAHSGDRGATWTTTSSGVTGDSGWPRFRRLAGTDGGDVWAVGSRSLTESVLVHSADHGQSWQIVPAGVVTALQAVWAFDRTAIVAADYEAGVIRSEDGGATWARHDAEPGTLLFGLWASGPADLYAVGGEQPASDTTGDADGGAADAAATVTSLVGVVLHSTDGGLSWTRVATASTGALWNVWGTPDGRTVYAGGAAGTMAWTTDGGATWQSSGLPAPNSLFDLDDVWVSPGSAGPFFASPEAIVRGVRTLPDGGPAAYDVEALPPNPATDTTRYLNAFAIWGTGDDDVWAVGPGGALWHRP